MSSVIFCDTCGAANSPGQQFCFSCGRALSASSASVPSNFPTGRLPPNTLLKQRYRVLRTVGKGGMGAVYAAEDTELGDRLVAIKEMSQQRLSSPQEIAHAAENFKHEAHLLAKLQSSHLPSIHDYFTEAGRWYLVMSFISGETLQYYLARSGGKLPVDEVLQIGITLCTVLEYLHAQRPPIIFRDLKPSNIMRTPEGELFLIDFGIARHFKLGQAKDTAIFGSAGYAAPEQYGRSQTTPRSDIYSLGAILYQLLSGRQPSLTPFNFPPLQSSGLALPPDLETLIMSMLSMDESERPQSMLIVKQELQRISAAFAPTAFNPPAPSASKQTATRAAPLAGFNAWLSKQNINQANIAAWLKAQNPLKQVNQASINAWKGRQNPFKQPPVPAKVIPANQPRLRVSRQQVTATIAGIVLCTLVTLWLDHGTFPTWFSFVVGNVPFRVSLFLVLDMVTLVIALFFGAQFGPWSGLLVGGIGPLIGDYIGFAGGHFGWNWDLRVAIVGFLVGWLLVRARSRLHSFNPSRASLYRDSALALIPGTAFASYADLWLHHETLAVASIIFLVYSAISIVICLLLLSTFYKIYHEGKKGAHAH